MKGAIRLPPSSDLFFVGIVMAIAAKVTMKISPCTDMPFLPLWEKIFMGHASLLCEGDSCTVSPLENGAAGPIALAYEEIPYKDFVVFCLLGCKKSLSIDPLPRKRLDIWTAFAAECGCTLNVSEQFGVKVLSLCNEDRFRIRDSVKNADQMHALLGLGMGLSQQIAVTTDSAFSSALRTIVPSFGFDLNVSSNLRDKNDDPIARRMRFMQMGKKTNTPILYNVTADFTKKNNTPCEITVPGDDVLCAVVLAAKCVVPRGSLIVENAGLESWNSQTLALVKKMGGVVAMQETGITSFGSVGTISVQKMGLAGRKVECLPLYSYSQQLPAMVIIAAFAQGQSVFRGIEDLRNDEPDGIDKIVSFVKAAGMRFGEMPDGIVIDGGRQYDGFDIAERLSAPLAAAATVAALHCMGVSTINEESIVRRWPRFAELVLSLCELKGGASSAAEQA